MTAGVTSRAAGGGEASSPVGLVIDRLGRQIREGAYGPGEKLPSVRQLGTEFGVSSNTIIAAFGILESQRMVVRHPRKGVFVRRTGSSASRLPVGIVTPSTSGFAGKDSWEGHVTVGCFSELVQREHKPELLHWPADTRPDWRIVRDMLAARRGELGGVIVTWSIGDEQALRALIDETGVPVIKIGRSSDSCRHNYVTIDHFGAGRLAAEKVLDRLPGPFLIFSGPSPHDFPRRRLADGFVDRLHEARPPRLRVDIVRVSHEPGAAAEAMETYLKDNGPPRCVFSIGDPIAIEAMNAAQAKGFRVPQDIAFVGSAGLDACSLSRPTLAHTRQPMEQLGAAAVNLLDEMRDNGVVWRTGRELPVTWIDGGSVGPVS